MVEASPSKGKPETNHKIGAEVLILEHRTPFGGYCISSRGKIIGFDARVPVIQCINPDCQRVGVSLDTKNKIQKDS